MISNIETLIAQTAHTRLPPTDNISSQAAQSQSDIDFKKLSMGLAAKGKKVDSEKIKEIISLYNLLSHGKKAKDDSLEKNKPLSDTLVDFLSTGDPKDQKQIIPSNRQETPQQVSSTSEISLAERMINL